MEIPANVHLYIHAMNDGTLRRVVVTKNFDIPTNEEKRTANTISFSSFPIRALQSTFLRFPLGSVHTRYEL